MGIVANLAKAYLFYEGIKAVEKSVTINNDRTIEIDTETFSADVVAQLLGTGTHFYTNSYDLCPAVGLSVQKKAQSITRGKMICTDTEYKAIAPKQGFTKAMQLLQRPNIFQNYAQFLGSIETYVNIYGACYLYLIKSVIDKNKVIGIIPIPNNFITTYYKPIVNILANQFDIVDYYYINMFGETFKVEGEQKENIYVIYDSKINLHAPFTPSSRLDSIKTNINNVIASINSRNTIITKRGIEGILSPEKSSDPTASMMSLDENERNRLQTEWRRYGTMSHQFSTLITKLAMKYQAISRPIAELGLFDGENADYRVVALAFGVPVPLLSLPEATKYNTYLEAKTEFYEDTIIPEAQNITQAFDTIFKSKEEGYQFYLDYSQLACMQTSEKDKATTFGQIVTALNNAIETNLISLSDAKIILEDYK